MTPDSLAANPRDPRSKPTQIGDDAIVSVGVHMGPPVPIWDLWICSEYTERYVHFATTKEALMRILRDALEQTNVLG